MSKELLSILPIVFSLLIIGNLSVFGEPYLMDTNFRLEKYVSDLVFPTSMAFLNDDIIILEKFSGNVLLVQDGVLQPEPILHVDALNSAETGLLGITTLDSTVYLYFTEKDIESGKVFGNRIYKYEWDGEKLRDGILVKDLPHDTSEPSQHAGGAMVTSSDGMVYAVIGDTMSKGFPQNMDTGSFDDTSVIIKVNQDEKVLKPSQTSNPTEHYYAMGIRNSFGLAIDPETGFLWDTENGPSNFDEINLVEPKFNSGWRTIMGPSTEEQLKKLSTSHGFHYSEPEFSWDYTVAPTDLTFVNSDLFDDYKDHLLVADYVSGSIYKFKLNSDRTGFVFEEPTLKDLVLNPDDKFNEILFGSGFGGLTNLEFGPDGLLYVLSFGTGQLYRITPIDSSEISEFTVPKWIKNNAGWWADELIEDSEFISGLQYLINQQILVLSKTDSSSSTSNTIPGWIKNTAGFWANDQILDIEFVRGIQFLVSNGIITISIEQCDTLPTSGIILSSCDLFEKDFSNLILNRANFEMANLTLTDLSNSEFGSANFDQAILIGSNLTNSKLNMASLEHANLKSSKLKDAVLLFARLEGATITDADISSANLERSNFKNTDLTNSNLSDSSMRFIILDYSTLKGANLSNTNLYLARINHADITGANLIDANLLFAKLNHSDLTNVDITNGFLRGIELSHSKLTNAVLTNSNLSLANLTNAEITNANLLNANLTQAKISGTNFMQSNLSGADLHRSKIIKADLSKANLTDTDFTKARIIDSNFTNTILTNADFTDAVLTNTDFTGANLDDALGAPFLGCIGHPACN